MHEPFKIDLQRFHDGNAAYFKLLLQRFGSQVDAIVFSYARDDLDLADDLRQESWVRLHKKRRSYRGEGDFGAWLHRLAHHACIQELRKRTRRAAKHEKYEEQLDAAPPSQPDEDFDRADFRSSLMRALGQLPKRQQDAFYLTRVEEYSVNEAAELMGTKPATVRSHVRHAIEKLRELLKEWE